MTPQENSIKTTSVSGAISHYGNAIFCGYGYARVRFLTVRNHFSLVKNTNFVNIVL